MDGSLHGPVPIPRAAARVRRARRWAAAPAGAVTVNGGFESGDLTGWNTVGDVSVRGTILGVTPPEGSFQVLLTTRTGAGAVDIAMTEAAMGLQADTLLDIFDTAGISSGSGPEQGSAIQQTFSANAGATLTFDDLRFQCGNLRGTRTISRRCCRGTSSRY